MSFFLFHSLQKEYINPDFQKRYLMNQIRNEFGLTGTPIRLIVREKGNTIETK